MIVAWNKSSAAIIVRAFATVHISLAGLVAMTGMANAQYFEYGRKVVGKRFTANGSLYCPGRSGKIDRRMLCGVNVIGNRSTIVSAQHCFVYTRKAVDKKFLKERIESFRFVSPNGWKGQRLIREAVRTTALRRDFLRPDGKYHTRNGSRRIIHCRARFYTTKGKSIWRNVVAQSLIFGTQTQKLESFDYTLLPFDMEGAALPARAAGHNRYLDWAVGRLDRPLPKSIEPLRLPVGNSKPRGDLMTAARGIGLGIARRKLYGGKNIRLVPLKQKPELAERWRLEIGTIFSETVGVALISRAPGFSGTAVSSSIVGVDPKKEGIFRGIIVSTLPVWDAKQRKKCQGRKLYRRIVRPTYHCGTVIVLANGEFMRTIKRVMARGKQQ